LRAEPLAGRADHPPGGAGVVGPGRRQGGPRL